MTFDIKELILSSAYHLAQENGYNKLRRDGIAKYAGVASGSINYHFHDMVNLKKAVMTRAVENESLAIIAAGLAQGDTVALKARPDLRRAALDTLM